MTVSSQTNKSGPYNENGVTTAFPYEFAIRDASHIKVVRASAGVETVLALVTDYTVTGVGNPSGGSVVIAVPSNGTTLTMVRNVPLTQELDLENQGSYNAEDVEAALDLAAQRDQQLAEEIGRAVKVPVSADAADLDTLIEGVIALLGSVDAITTVAGIAPQIVTVSGIATEVETVAGISAYIVSVADISADVSAVAGISAQVQAVAAFEDEIITVAGISAAVQVVAAKDAEVVIVALNIAAVNSASANMPAIIAAPGAASAAAGSAAAAAASAASIDPTTLVKTTTQSLSEAAQAQARKNIGLERGWPLIHVIDQKPSSTDGGANASSAMNLRTLNTVLTNEIAGASLASSAVTLPAGEYEIEARAPMFEVGRSALYLYNVTDGATIASGTSVFGGSLGSQEGGMVTLSMPRLSLAAPKSIRIHQWMQLSHAQGFGVAANSGAPEIYAQFIARKLK